MCEVKRVLTLTAAHRPSMKTDKPHCPLLAVLTPKTTATASRIPGALHTTLHGLSPNTRHVHDGGGGVCVCVFLCLCVITRSRQERSENEAKGESAWQAPGCNGSRQRPVPVEICKRMLWCHACTVHKDIRLRFEVEPSKVLPERTLRCTW